MFNINNIFEIQPYSLSCNEKSQIYVDMLKNLTEHHMINCPQYNKLLNTLGFKLKTVKNVEEFPYIPVRLFKEYELLSIDKSQVIKTMTSSGTTGHSVSKIFLDKVTSLNQTKALTKIVSSFTGKKRLPMLIIDTSAVIKDRNLFSARGAGILGFSMLGYDIKYALDENMNLDIEGIRAFLKKHDGETIFLFGFTFMIWEHFYRVLHDTNNKLNLENSVLIHGGGWKKLADQAVDNNCFKGYLNDVCGISKIYNYYGMVEQTGSIFMECEEGHLHSSIYSDVIIRDHKDFRDLGTGEKGLIQLISLLPLSYPGHSILSEDLGELIGEDDCPCGRKGKYFKIYGRIKSAEVRGCSDTYAVRKP